MRARPRRRCTGREEADVEMVVVIRPGAHAPNTRIVKEDELHAQDTVGVDQVHQFLGEPLRILRRPERDGLLPPVVSHGSDVSVYTELVRFVPGDRAATPQADVPYPDARSPRMGARPGRA